MTLEKEAYEQNYQHFRSLNQIMWQIPVLAMTLTGGLWFGVSKLEDNLLLVTILLLTAVIGNLALACVLVRFRHVMGCYLNWLKTASPQGFVDASTETAESTFWQKYCNRDKTVRNLFLFMLLWSAGCSLFVLGGYWHNKLGVLGLNNSNPSLQFYDEHAVALADSYESVAFESAYPLLASKFTSESSPLNVLDIGAGTGRDAAWIASKGHKVVAVEPSSSMLTIAKKLHSSEPITWINTELPDLENVDAKPGSFDVILVNAVWMHIVPEDRPTALRRIQELLNPEGSIFVSLRLGPIDEERGMFEVSSSEFARDAKTADFDVIPRGNYEDLLGRAEVSWKIFELKLQN